MTLFSLVVLAIGLSMDSFAVSITSGVLMPCFSVKKSCQFAAVMAIFQGVMPVIGWLLGLGFRGYIEAYDHWVAFGLLLFLGIRMIYEGLQHKEEACFDPCDFRTEVGLAVATSIDALAVGITLSFLRVDMLQAAVIIALTTFAFSMVGLYIGRFIGSRLQKGAEVLGGIILVLIGVKICVEHLFFS